MKDLEALRAAIAEFVRERNWDQFHSPKNLVMALSVETAELMEHFQWLTLEDAGRLDADKLVQVGEEIADVQIYLIRLADSLGIDILAACEDKIAKNAVKYPVDKASGNSRKYTELE